MKLVRAWSDVSTSARVTSCTSDDEVRNSVFFRRRDPVIRNATDDNS